jgi:DNA-binding response OmpR family regulator
MAKKLRAGLVTLDLDRFLAVVGNERISLTPTEFDILEHLVRNSARVVSRGELLERVVRSVYRSDCCLRVHILHLRRKLGAAAHAVRTVRGRGFWFDVSQVKRLYRPVEART